MNESQVEENKSGDVPVEPRNRSTGALVLFVLLALPMPLCLFFYHYFLWFLEQNAIASASVAFLGWSGLVGLAVQGILMTGIAIALWRLTTDLRFKPVYSGWLVAALMAFPALLLRLLGPNNDQLGSLLQILICVIAALIVTRVRGTKISWRENNLAFAFLLAAFGVGIGAGFWNRNPINLG